MFGFPNSRWLTYKSRRHVEGSSLSAYRAVELRDEALENEARQQGCIDCVIAGDATLKSCCSPTLGSQASGIWVVGVRLCGSKRGCSGEGWWGGSITRACSLGLVDVGQHGRREKCRREGWGLRSRMHPCFHVHSSVEFDLEIPPLQWCKSCVLCGGILWRGECFGQAFGEWVTNFAILMFVVVSGVLLSRASNDTQVRGAVGGGLGRLTCWGCSVNADQRFVGDMLTDATQDVENGGVEFRVRVVAVMTETAITAKTVKTVKTVTVASWSCILEDKRKEGKVLCRTAATVKPANIVMKATPFEFNPIFRHLEQPKVETQCSGGACLLRWQFWFHGCVHDCVQGVGEFSMLIKSLVLKPLCRSLHVKVRCWWQRSKGGPLKPVAKGCRRVWRL